LDLNIYFGIASSILALGWGLDRVIQAHRSTQGKLDAVISYLEKKESTINNIANQIDQSIKK
jgi:hypothetical protein